MRYLCPDHWEAMCQIPEQKLSEYCVRWLTLSHRYRDQEQKRQALAFAGCAWDVAGIRLSRFPDGDWSLAVLLGLSGITLARQLRDMGQAKQAEEVLDLSCSRLAECVNKDCPCWRSSLKVLTEENLWSAYLHFHLGVATGGYERYSRARITAASAPAVMH